MLRIPRTLTSSLAILAIAAVVAPINAHAWPLGKILHLHPATEHTQDTRITVELFNKGILSQDVKVEGRIYTVEPHQGLAIKAPKGTVVFAASAGLGHRSGDLLIAFAPEISGRVVYFN